MNQSMTTSFKLSN